MPSFVFRSQARDYAVSQGWANFRTKQHPTDRTWTATYEPGESPAAKYLGLDFVAWIETDWNRDVSPSQKIGVVVVSITKEELDEVIIGNADYERGGIRFEPQTPDLWSKGDVTASAPRTRAAKGDGEASGPRAKSDVESPVKLVWRIADEMKGAPRNEVIAACVAKGVNKATASTQFYRWQKAKNV